MPNTSRFLPPRVLFVVTSHAQLGDTGRSTGFYVSEIAHPYAVFKREGFAVDVASPQGGTPPQDGVKLEDPVQQAFFDDTGIQAKVQTSLTPHEVDPSRYDAVFYVGGHGTMWDFPDDRRLAEITAAIYDRGGVVAAVCHGPAALVNVRLANGEFLVSRKAVSAFTDDEEAAAKLTTVVPFLLESKLAERGARIEKAGLWEAKVSVDERLVTGQNPASATGVGEAVARLLNARNAQPA